MSIIYEALKKIEERDLKPQAFTYPSTKRPFPYFLIFLFLGLSGWGFYFLYKSKPSLKVPAYNNLNSFSPSKNERLNPTPGLSLLALESPLKEKASLSAKTSYILQGIVYDAGASFAIINGKKVTTGEGIGKARLIRISEDSVELEIDKERFSLTLE